MGITVKPMSDALGSEILGIDLTRELDTRDAADIYAAWLEHLVIVVRGQTISDEDQIRFAGYFGTVGAYHRPKAMQHAKHSSSTIMLISNIREDGAPIGAHPDGEMMFHTDTAYHEHPTRRPPCSASNARRTAATRCFPISTRCTTRCRTI